ncbi:MAG: hypothetical protein K9H16_01355, partial [Bacteroidales bacterium]|nr:hypothetical protein [Bacteroidales bacterium]
AECGAKRRTLPPQFRMKNVISTERSEGEISKLQHADLRFRLCNFRHNGHFSGFFFVLPF